MKRLAVIFFLILASRVAHADFVIFAGGGLGTGQLTLEQANIKSNFHDFSYFAEGGAFYQFSNGFGFLAGADYGLSHAYNNVQRSDYLEEAKNTYTSLKGGLMFSSLTLGGGVRSIDTDVKSVSTTSGTIETSYRGQVPMYFLSYTFTSSKNSFINTIVEIDYVNGKIDDLTYQDVSATLNLVMMLGR
jgi:hypothetical protein